MKSITCLVILLLFSCNKHQKDVKNEEDSSISGDTIQTEKPIETKQDSSEEYSNERFRKVEVEKIAAGNFRIQGEAQIFEANFSWVVEDGHYELEQGHEMTDAGAPEWGKFDFTIEVQKKRENSTLTLILFEISAKDGSRQYGLPIPLK